MTRLLTIVATVVVALAVSAAPASAQGRVGGKMHLDDVSLGIVTDKALPKLADDAAATGWWQRR
jgi:hypothetical protein